jgi:hypothetical protein
MNLKKYFSFTIIALVILFNVPTSYAAPKIEVTYLPNSSVLYGIVETWSNLDIIFAKEVISDAESSFRIVIPYAGAVKFPLHQDATITIGEEAFPIKLADPTQPSSYMETQVPSVTTAFFIVPDDLMKKIADTPSEVSISLTVSNAEKTKVFEFPLKPKLRLLITEMYPLKKEDYGNYSKDKKKKYTPENPEVKKY